MRGVTGDDDPGIGPDLLNKYAGHGTFIAGIIRAVAPAAEVVVRAVFPGPNSPLTGQVDGAAFEGDIVAALEDCLLHDNPDIISLSAGTGSSRVDGPGLLNAFYEDKLRHYKGITVVAAAGNDGWRNRFWPAAAPWTVSVGALAANWRKRAHFSNHGSWVDVYAPGEHLINAFPIGNLTYHEPPRIGNTASFTGLAHWSGTSFSTPVVAGLIAARMSKTGENGTAAAAALVAQAQHNALPGVGAVLLPEA
jgi:subtilisin family serine protease